MENSVAYLTLILYLLILILVFLTFFEWKKLEKKYTNTKRIKIAIGFGFVFLLFSFLAPKLFIIFSSILNFNESTAHIGDTLAIMNPFIAITGVIFTFLAFYIQKLSNDEIKKQFKIQQFESQFFEMLHLHKENVNELRQVNFLFFSQPELQKKEAKGREVFFVMSEIFETLLAYIKENLSPSLTNETFEEAYLIFFWGMKYALSVNKDFQNQLIGKDNYAKKPYGCFLHYNGVSFSLGHYFRHLFLTVKFVVNSDIIIDYEDKMKYLKILRAQLSNHEQIMLFYNWLSGYGEAWEDDENNFFTDYKMIHNLWNEQLFQDQYIVDAVNDLIDKYNSKHTGERRVKPLFEFQGNNPNKKMINIA